MKTLEIEMVHDIVCSWCPIGYANLKQAIRNLKIEANIRFLPYELNPDMGAEGEDIDDYFARRHQWNQSRRQDYREHLLATAKLAGVPIDFAKRTRYYNSSKAHRLIHWSESQEKHIVMNELLIDAYFRLGLDISNSGVLVGLVEQLGLDRSSAEYALTSEKVAQQMIPKWERVKALGLSGIPVFIFNEVNVASGSNSVEYFEEKILELTGKMESTTNSVS